MADNNDSPSFLDQLKDHLSKISATQPIAGLSANGNQVNIDPNTVQDAINTSSGVVGSIQGPSLAALKQLAGVAPAATTAVEDAAPSLAQKIKQAAQNSSVKWIPTADQAADAAVQAQYQDAPKTFFANAKLKAAMNGVGASPAEQAAMKAQGDQVRNAISQRNLEQIGQANRLTDEQAAALSKLYNGGE